MTNSMIQKHDIIVIKGGKMTECPYLVTRIEGDAYYGVYQKTGEPHTSVLIPPGEYELLSYVRGEFAERVETISTYYTINQGI